MEDIQISAQSGCYKHTRQFWSCFSANFRNSVKFTGNELVSKIHITIRVLEKVSNTTNGTKFRVLSAKYSSSKLA